MKRQWIWIAAIAGLAGLLGILILWRWIFSPVRIRVDNQVDSPAELVEILDVRGGLAVSAKSIPAGGFIEIHFPPTGEADFMVRATVKGEPRSSNVIYSDLDKSFNFVIRDSSIDLAD